MVLGGQPPGRVARSHVIFFYTCKTMFHEERKDDNRMQFMVKNVN